jgi:hypothetical protein
MPEHKVEDVIIADKAHRVDVCRRINPTFLCWHSLNKDLYSRAVSTFIPAGCAVRALEVENPCSIRKYGTTADNVFAS